MIIVQSSKGYTALCLPNQSLFVFGQRATESNPDHAHRTGKAS